MYLDFWYDQGVTKYIYPDTYTNVFNIQSGIFIVHPRDLWIQKGTDLIRLEFAQLFPLNSGAPIASASFISDGKVQVSPYGYIWGCFIIHTNEGVCPTNGGFVIQEQRVGTIQSLSSQTHW